MHPDLWTVPGTGFTITSYGFCMLLGFALAVWIASVRARRAQGDPGVITTVALLGLAAGLIGSRAMHLVHYCWGALRGGQMGVTDVAAMGGGGEIMGGVLLAFAVVVVYLALKRRSIRLYLDIIMPSVILAMGIGRIGCLMFGCCWGETCTTDSGDRALPWAVRFPYGSPAYVHHWQQGELDVPGELMWVSPVTKQREPFPRRLLSDPALADERLAGFAALGQEMAALERAEPDHPRLAELRNRMRTLGPSLPGRDEAQRFAYVAAARRLHELASRSGGSVSGALAEVRALAAQQHSLWVHPTQVYDAIGLVLLFLVLSAILRRRRRHGVVVAWGMILYSISRFLQEMVRADNPRDVAGLTVSQFLSLAVLLLGVVYLVLILKVLPEQSPAAQRAGASGSFDSAERSN